VHAQPPITIQYIPSRTKLWCALQLRGQIFSTLPLYVQCSVVWHYCGLGDKKERKQDERKKGNMKGREVKKGGSCVKGEGGEEKG